MKETKHIQVTGKSSDKIRVLWLANIPSPYRIDFLNELGRLCVLTVLFERRTSSERDESWGDYRIENFQGVFLRGKALGTAEAFCPEILRYIRKKYHYIVVTNYSDPTGLLAIMWMKARKMSYLIEGDGAFPKSGKGIRESIKRWAISGADACFSTGKMHDAYYSIYGAKLILRYPFTSVKASELRKFPVSFQEKTRIRESLGILEKQVVLAVGQMIPRKGYDVLIRAAEKTSPDIGYYIIGGLPQDSFLKTENLTNHRLHFIHFVKHNELRQYYLAADLFVHPCREDIWGLVVNEALSCGLPVISTEKCNAALELVKDGVNGCLIPPGDSEALAAAVEKYMKCVDKPKAASERNLKCRDMSEAASNSVREYTIEKMAERHMEVFLDGLV